MPILECKEVSRYFGGLAALSRVNFHVEQGEVLGLIGPNGAGKTTLFNLMSAALKPQSGTIRFKDTDVKRLGPYKICRMGLARTFQTVRIFPNMTVLSHAILASYFGRSPGMSSPEALRSASETLEFVGLSAVKAIPAKDLTLANQKRLEVARALGTHPEILLLDEIMAGLNPAEVAQAMELVIRIRNKGITIIMIEHVMKAIMSLCDRIIVLHHGQKIAEGTPQEIATSEKVIKVYLGDKAHAGSK
jgi:branched-chain amino acid transport system ATP-binding protein